ncbi:MAG TPA: alpha-ribazole phosphatase family protein [Sulfurimonas sp.]|uniref:alpha-ribazole phosphatase family protein n=1 Tax=Sulfurimonas sp. TaxID=2022749 RepID=UPI002B89EF33|nr:alpha-ribazole phosphatase family protein [Sulfurimonas sp.]HUH43053.1 alpha-ribazole phosphatase family protein [Sulfurimonas sp.]
MKLTLVRHCEVDEKYKNCYNGHNDIGLSENGELQAKELCQVLDTLEFDDVFCSDLSRTKESLKHSLHVKSAIYTDKLREKSWGVHEGMSYDEIVEREKIEYIDFMQWIDVLGGESYTEYIKRVKEFFYDYLPSLNNESILVITHAGVIRVLLSIIHDISLEEAFSTKVEYGSLTLKRIKNKNL